MALILNLETATTVCSVSLAKDGNLLALKEQNGDYSHAENLTLFIEDVLKQAQVKISELDAIAVSKGPGSYTGLRIGVSTAKGLCYALGKPLIAIDTLKHIALAASQRIKDAHPKSLFCPMLDARRMEVYCALFDTSLNYVKETAAEIIDEFSFKELLSPSEKSEEGYVVYFFGDGASKCKPILSKNENAIFKDAVFPSAKNMITLSENKFFLQQFEDVAYFEPFYLKDFVAGKKKQSSL